MSQHQHSEDSAQSRVYRNPRAAAGLIIVGAVVFALTLRSAFSRSEPTILRVFAIALVLGLGMYIVRAALVQVRVTAKDLRVRNTFASHRIPWDQVAAIEPVPAYGRTLSSAYTLAFRLKNGHELRPQGLRRSLADASAIASDLSQFLPRSAGAEDAPASDPAGEGTRDAQPD